MPTKYPQVTSSAWNSKLRYFAIALTDAVRKFAQTKKAMPRKGRLSVMLIPPPPGEEDANTNGVLDSGEDANSNGILDTDNSAPTFVTLFVGTAGDHVPTANARFNKVVQAGNTFVLDGSSSLDVELGRTGLSYEWVELGSTGAPLASAILPGVSIIDDGVSVTIPPP